MTMNEEAAIIQLKEGTELMKPREILTVIRTLIAQGSNAGAQLITVDSTSTSITLQWTAPGDDGNSGTAASYDLRYSLAMIYEYNWNTAIQVNNEPPPHLAGATETRTVANLRPAATYYFAIKAADEAGNVSALSNVAVKSTASEQIPPAVITNLLVSNPTANSILLTWTAPGDDGNSGIASEYDIRYSTSTIDDNNWDAASQVSGEPSPRAAGSPESFTVSGLQPGTTYYFAIKTADEIPNWSGISNIASAATLSDQDNIAPNPVTDFTVSDITDNSVTLTWTAPGDDGDQGQATTYDIRYDTSYIGNDTWGSCTPVSGEPSPQPPGSAETFTVDNLQPGVTYYFAIKTYDEVPNYSLLSNIPSATIGSGNIPPAAITDLQATESNQNSISLSWTTPGSDGDEGQASEYDIRYSISPIDNPSWDSATQANNEPAPAPAGAMETFTLTGLQGETRYYFAIKTADEVPNWSELSNIETAVTPDQTPPGTITDLSADNNR
jgi:hypothetical protein